MVTVSYDCTNALQHKQQNEAPSKKKKKVSSISCFRDFIYFARTNFDVLRRLCFKKKISFSNSPQACLRVLALEMHIKSSTWNDLA